MLAADDSSVKSVQSGEQTLLELSPSRHTLRVAWCIAPPVRIESVLSPHTLIVR
jgi:hypothetical protein